MIRMRNTENMTGVTISGDFDDLYELVEAFHELAVDDDSEKYKDYIEMSIRLLGVCYDLRHAYQGDRDVKLVDNNMDDAKMDWHSMIVPTNNVYYECNCFYPEMFYATIAISELINVRTQILTKRKTVFYDSYVDKKVVFDKPIAVMRNFQCAFSECVKEVLTPNQHSRWVSSITKPYISLRRMAGQYLDKIVVDYIKMSKENRLKNLTKISKSISDYWLNDEYRRLEDGIYNAAREYGCAISDIKLADVEYPNEIEW